MTYWDDLERHRRLDGNWMSDPLVRRHVNRRVTGDPDVWPIPWLKERLGERLPFRNALNIGCGIGNLERDLVSQGIVTAIVGIDVSATCVAEARQVTRDSRIRYEVADAHQFLTSHSGFDAIFFHGSLHHLDRLDELMRLTSAAMTPDGLLYLDEYVGRSRFEWRWWHLVLPNLLYLTLPASIRKVKVVGTLVNHDDPTEAIASSSILRALERSFSILERHDYGGNLVEHLYGVIRRPNEEPPSSPQTFDRALNRLFVVEEFFLRHKKLLRFESAHTVVIARPRV